MTVERQGRPVEDRMLEMFAGKVATILSRAKKYVEIAEATTNPEVRGKALSVAMGLHEAALIFSGAESQLNAITPASLGDRSVNIRAEEMRRPSQGGSI